MTIWTTSPPPLRGPDGQLVPMFGFLCFHEALRRDAARFRTVAADPARLDAEGVAGLREHWVRYHALLTIHHEMEDQRLFALVRSVEPSLGARIDDLTGEHHQLDGLLGRLDPAVGSLTPGHGAEAALLFAELDDLLVPHLAAEEEHLLPVARRAFAEGGGPPGPPQGAQAQEEGPVPESFAQVWLTEHLDDETVQLALALQPEPVRAAYPESSREYRTELARWWEPQDR